MGGATAPAPNDEGDGSGAAAFGSRRSLCIHKQLCSEEECPLWLLLTARCLTTAEPHSERESEIEREREIGRTRELRERGDVYTAAGENPARRLTNGVEWV